MCSGFLVIDVFPLLLCVFLLDGTTSVVVGLSPCTALLDSTTRNTILYSHLTSKTDQTKIWITEEQATQ